MLQPFQNAIDNPEDLPLVSPHVAEYLQTRLNPGWLFQSGVVKRLQAEGRSETFILGFLAGCQHAVEVIDLIENVRKILQEDGER